MPPLTPASSPNPRDLPPPQPPSRPAKPDDRTPTMLDWALRYAALGVPVLPLHSVIGGRCTCGDTACDNVGKHPHTWHGKDDGTTDVATIRSWWAEWPDANIGGVVPDEQVVFDIDPRHGGQPTALAPTPPTVMAMTGGGGYHLYFSTTGTKLPDRLPGKMPGASGIDLRTAGKHYVVLPPSIHASGRHYAWVTSPLDGATAAPLPDHLAARLWERPTLSARPSSITANGGGGDSPANLGGPIGPGERNMRLTSIAGSLRRQGLPEDTIAETLQRINEEHCDPPLGRAEVAAIACSVARYRPEPTPATSTPWQPTVVTTAGPVRLAEPNGAVARYAETDGEPAPVDPLELGLREAEAFSDTGNAERLAHLYADRLRYVPQWGWLVYQDGVWRRDVGEVQVVRCAKDALRAATELAAERMLAEHATEEVRKRCLVWLKHLNRSFNRLSHMVQAARSCPALLARVEDFDRDPYLLNCPNGTLDLRSGAFRAHRPGDLLTKQTRVAYDPTATAPTWDRFIHDLFAGDADLIAFVQRALGYSLTGSTREQVYFTCYGSGCNGKSTLLGVVSRLLGDYAQPLRADYLMEQHEARTGPDPELAALVGARLVTAQEPTLDKEGDAPLENSARIKALTGGDPLQVRDLYGKPFTFEPDFKLWLSVNQRPKVREHTEATWRRMRLIPFSVSFEGRADTDLKDKLLAEAAGILVWLANGARRWWEAGGLGTAERVQEATQSYREEEDPTLDFFTCWLMRDADPAAHVMLCDLPAAYKAWREAQFNETGAYPPHAGDRELAKLAEAHGYPRQRVRAGKDKGRVAVCGCRLATPSERSERKAAISPNSPTKNEREEFYGNRPISFTTFTRPAAATATGINDEAAEIPAPSSVPAADEEDCACIACGQPVVAGSLYCAACAPKAKAA